MQEHGLVVVLEMMLELLLAVDLEEALMLLY
jgi:hypothetical protein